VQLKREKNRKENDEGLLREVESREDLNSITPKCQKKIPKEGAKHLDEGFLDEIGPPP